MIKCPYREQRRGFLNKMNLIKTGFGAKSEGNDSTVMTSAASVSRRACVGACACFERLNRLLGVTHFFFCATHFKSTMFF